MKSALCGNTKDGLPIIVQERVKTIQRVHILVEPLWEKFAKNPAIYVQRVIYSKFLYILEFPKVQQGFRKSLLAVSFLYVLPC